MKSIILISLMFLVLTLVNCQPTRTLNYHDEHEVDSAINPLERRIGTITY